MTFAIFVRSELVTNPGWKGIEDMLIISIACWGVSFAMFGRISSAKMTDLLVRTVLGLFSLAAMLYPDDTVALGAAVIVALVTFYGTYRHRTSSPARRARCNRCPSADLRPAEHAAGPFSSRRFRSRIPETQRPWGSMPTAFNGCSGCSRQRVISPATTGRCDSRPACAAPSSRRAAAGSGSAP